MSDLTVAICSYNRAEKLIGLLDSMSRQTILARVDVLVINDGSSDDTAEVAARYGFVRLVSHEVNRGLAAARNTALGLAETEWIAFTDDDCRPEHDWAERMLEVIVDHPGVFAVGGRVTAEPAPGIVNAFLRAKSPFAPLELALVEDNGFWHRLRQYLLRSATSELDHGARRVASLTGACMAIRRDVALELGGWDARFVIGGEEEELFRRALETGADLVFDPRPQVVHAFDNTVRDLVGRAHRYGRGNARMQVKHGGLPTLYPAPVLVSAALVATPLTLAAPAAAVMIPLGLFSVWPRRAWQKQDLQALAFPYFQLLQEAASNVGWVSAWMRERQQFDRTSRVPARGAAE